MILSDKTIIEMMRSQDIGITPEPKLPQVQPVSVDLLLGSSFVVFSTLDGEPHKLAASEYRISPGQFMLGSTRERIRLPRHISARVCGKSTWARRGLLVEAAGLVDPGFDGTITVELFNMSTTPLLLRAEQAICQISFEVTDFAVLRPYGSDGLNSHYQGQTKAEPAR